MIAVSVSIFTFSALTGCAGLEAQLQGSPVADDAKPAVGLTYFLPSKLLEVEANFTVTDCDGAVPDGELPRFSYATKLTLNEVVVADRSQAYAIDYEQLNALTKVTNTTFTVLPNGTLGAINTAVADHTGAVIGNAVSAGLGIARAAMFPESAIVAAALSKGVADAAGQAPFALGPLLKKPPKELVEPPPSACHPQLTKDLAKVQELKKKLEEENRKDKERAQAKAALDEAKASVVAARAAFRQLPKQHTAAERNEALAEEKRAIAERGTAAKRLESLGDSAGAELVVALNKALEKLTYVAKGAWLPAPDNRGPVALSVGEDVAKHLYGIKTAGMVATNCGKDPLANNCVDWRPGIVVRLVDLGEKPSAHPHETARVDTSSGVWYRRPVHTRIVACRGECPADARGNIVFGDRVVHQKLVSVPQLGVTGLLTLTNRIFDDNSLEVAFDADGAVSRLVFTSKARAEAASAAAAESSAKYLDFLKQGAAERRSELKAMREDKVSELNARLDAIKKLGEIEKARVGLQGSQDAEIQHIKSETEKLDAQIELERKRRELEQFKAGGRQ
jgi:hypothetical protein